MSTDLHVWQTSPQGRCCARCKGPVGDSRNAVMSLGNGVFWRPLCRACLHDVASSLWMQPAEDIEPPVEEGLQR